MSSTDEQIKAKSNSMEPLAIVGMSCTLSGGVNSPSSLWQTLLQKEIKQNSSVPESRFSIDAYFHNKAFGRPAAIGSKGGYFLDTKLDAFDAEFFGYEPDEAQHMDPQHFRILESVYECLESAGRTLEEVRGSRTAVYIGNFSLDKVISSARHSYDDRHLHEVIGIDPGLLSSRVSYCFDLNGPVFTTNTGCTSSLFALHTAAQVLRTGECDSAIVGGVNLLQGPEAYSSYSKFGIMSADSRCHPFDARCNGYCRAEGVGALYVRLLSDAIRDNDPIRGVIRSIAVNANGFVPQMPLFVPNKDGIERSMRMAYEQADLDSHDTAFIETHGIGMIIGELAEAAAVGLAMNQPRRRASPMLVGSLKPNFGHQEAASGIFVVIKAAKMTEEGIIPGHTDFQIPHPAINFDQLNIKVQSETISWPEGYPSRRVGLNSYGWSGTNAHIVVENVQALHPDYKLGQARSTAQYDHAMSRPFLLTFSAHKQWCLQENIDRLHEVSGQFYTADLAYTLNKRRSRFAHRAFALASDTENTTSFEQVDVEFGTASSNTEPPQVGLSFGPFGIDLLSLASEIFSLFVPFTKAIRAIDNILSQLNCSINVEQEIGRHPHREAPRDTTMATFLTTAIEIALVDLLTDWNIIPVLVEADASKDLIAAYAAGVLSIAEVAIYLFHIHINRDFSSEMLAQAEEIVTLHEIQPRTQIPVIRANDTSAKLNPEIVIVIGRLADSSRRSRVLHVSSVEELLKMAGQLFLHHYPVSLEKVNDIEGVDWKPSLLVDLPPYQWDHSKSYSIENHANFEHRTHKHAYHDLLGRRIHGLSPQTMIWKNKMSYKDLPESIPWIPNPKLRTVFGLAKFTAMTFQALAQSFSHVDVDGFILENLVLCKSLVYAEDCDLIELQTSLTRVASTSADQVMFRLNIDSVKEGVWTTHCHGLVHMYQHQPQESSTTVKAPEQLDRSGANHSTVTLNDSSTPLASLPDECSIDQAAKIAPAPTTNGYHHSVEADGDVHGTHITLTEEETRDYVLHPRLIETCLELAAPKQNGGSQESEVIFETQTGISRFSKVKLLSAIAGEQDITASKQHGTPSGVSVEVSDESGHCILRVEGIA